MATKMKTRNKGDETEILVLAQHPMETGQRTDKKTKKKIPAHYIETMNFTLNGKTVVAWKDNKGETGGAETTVK